MVLQISQEEVGLEMVSYKLWLLNLLVVLNFKATSVSSKYSRTTLKQSPVAERDGKAK